jgi:hypothetical protein
VGFLFAIFTLRLCRFAPVSKTARSNKVSQFALRVGLIISIIELPGVMLGQDVTLPICIVGWLGVLGGTLYQGWRVNGAPGRLDVFQLIGGIAGLLIFGSFMYVFAMEIGPGLQNVSILYLVRVIIIPNGFAAFAPAILSLFGLAIVSNIAERIRFPTIWIYGPNAPVLRVRHRAR